jgi:CTP synthase
MKSKYIFVVGGVMSGVGKGVAAASIAKIIQARGFAVTSLKIDPYVNVDAGTMNPTEHGETFVLDDGMECDQDMGNYERFLNTSLTKANYMTTGSVYQSVIQRERNLEYGGKCVEVVPHIPLEVISRIDQALKVNKAQIAITEIGGTVGEYQNILFLEAVRMLKIKYPKDVALVLVSYLPILANTGELKSKPTQYAVRSLNAAGLQPDIILARAKALLDDKRKQTIAINCSVQSDDIISAPDVESIYDVPLNFEKGDLSGRILKKLSLRAKSKDLQEWTKFVDRIHKSTDTVRIGIVGKYFESGDYTLTDSYISVIEGVKHGAAAAGKKPVIEWLSSTDFEGGAGGAGDPKKLALLDGYDGVIIPGGFGARGVEGKINVIQYLREHKIPYFGLCYGMQLAVAEYARHVAGMKDANTTEVNPKTTHPVIDILPEQKVKLAKKDYGGTMRLGAYPANIVSGTVAAAAYHEKAISERHRHRYEVNPEYIAPLEKAGLVFSGVSPDRRLMEIAELPKSVHPFFLGTQFHPELKSRPLAPHPLFSAFVKAAGERAGKR